MASEPSPRWSPTVVDNPPKMTASCHVMDHPAYCALLETEAQRFVTAVAGSDDDAAIPSCPGWTVADVAKHVGGLHRWAEAHVRRLSTTRIFARDLDLDVPADPRRFPEWIGAGADRLLATARAADPEQAVWTWGSDKHVRFWPRRMLYETTIHRADVELAHGHGPSVDRAVAVDGVDEFLDNLPHAVDFAPRVKNLRGSGETLSVRASDAGTVWTVRLKENGFAWDHSTGESRVAVEGASDDVLLLIYGRLEFDDESRFEVTGDRELLRRWLEDSAI